MDDWPAEDAENGRTNVYKDEGFDEFPELTLFLRHITNVKGLFNAAIYGQVESKWVESLERAALHARRASREVRAAAVKPDEIIKPMWKDQTNRELLFTRKMSRDAYLDLLQMDGQEIEPDLYDDPPSD